MLNQLFPVKTAAVGGGREKFGGTIDIFTTWAGKGEPPTIAENESVAGLTESDDGAPTLTVTGTDRAAMLGLVGVRRILPV